jgi:DNA-binding NarL/FixJ family response regulator
MQKDDTQTRHPDRLRILVVDDSPAVLKSLCAWVDSQPRLHVIGVAGNGQEAINAARISHPDLVLMDLEMPVMSGLHAAEALKRELPEIKIAIISTHASEMWSEISLNCGAEAFLSKQRIPQELPPLVERLFPPSRSDLAVPQCP